MTEKKTERWKSNDEFWDELEREKRKDENALVALMLIGVIGVIVILLLQNL